MRCFSSEIWTLNLKANEVLLKSTMFPGCQGQGCCSLESDTNILKEERLCAHLCVFFFFFFSSATFCQVKTPRRCQRNPFLELRRWLQLGAHSQWECERIYGSCSSSKLQHTTDKSRVWVVIDCTRKTNEREDLVCICPLPDVAPWCWTSHPP